MKIRKVIFYLVALTTVLGLRGSYLARMIGGRYSWTSLAQDVACIALLMAAFHLLYFGLNRLLGLLEKRSNRFWWYLAGAMRLSFVVLVVFPALLSFIQVHPQRIETAETPKSLGMNFEPVSFNSEGLRLSGWFLPNESNSESAVLLIHGLNANKQNFLYPAKLLHDAGFPVLIFDLRGHGDSEGRTFTFGIEEEHDVKAGYDWLRQRLPNRKYFGVGYSAGAAALLRATADYGIFDRIVLDSPLVNIERVAKTKFLWALGPFSGIAWFTGTLWTRLWTGVDIAKYDGAEVCRRIEPNKIFLIHGTADNLLPADESQKIAEAAGPQMKTWFIDKADHLQGIGDPSYAQRVRDFLS